VKQQLEADFRFLKADVQGPLHYHQTTVPMWTTSIKRQHPDMLMRGAQVANIEFYTLDGDGPYSAELSLLWFRIAVLQHPTGVTAEWTLTGASMPKGTVLSGPEQFPTGFILNTSHTKCSITYSRSQI
jgi:hypothetical protein